MTSLSITWVENVFDAARSGIDGAAKWDDEFGMLDYVCPCGCKEIRSLPVKVGDKEPHSWKWDGDRIAPTFTPSIQHIPHKSGACNWHGFMTKGEWVSA